MNGVDHIAAVTFHGRRGDTRNAFRYSVDYVMLDIDAPGAGPFGFGRNRAGLWSVRDRDHGGEPKQGKGGAWAREVLAQYGIDDIQKIALITQPRTLGYVFNPVSFWACYDQSAELRVVIAEVTNTFGDRHSYICRNDDLRPIQRDQWLTAQKIMHVSPFQPLDGGYRFKFDIRYNLIDIVIDYSRTGGGVVATLRGQRKPLSFMAMVAASIRRPLGSRRVMALIHWQAFRLWRKGVAYRTRPEPPQSPTSCEKVSQ